MSVCREMPACAGMTEVGLSANDQSCSFEWLSVHAESGRRTGRRARRQEGHPFSKPVSVDKPHDVAGIIMAHVAQHIKPKIGPAYPSGS